MEFPHILSIGFRILDSYSSEFIASAAKLAPKGLLESCKRAGPDELLLGSSAETKENLKSVIALTISQFDVEEKRNSVYLSQIFARDPLAARKETCAKLRFRFGFASANCGPHTILPSRGLGRSISAPNSRRCEENSEHSASQRRAQVERILLCNVHVLPQIIINNSNFQLFRGPRYTFRGLLINTTLTFAPCSRNLYLRSPPPLLPTPFRGRSLLSVGAAASAALATNEMHHIAGTPSPSAS